MFSTFCFSTKLYHSADRGGKDKADLGIKKAWIYGSFSREDVEPKSDIDVAVKTVDSFSYFDLAEVQYQLEKGLNRKMDIGFIDIFKPHILENLKSDLKLIYEKKQPY